MRKFHNLALQIFSENICSTKGAAGNTAAVRLNFNMNLP